MVSRYFFVNPSLQGLCVVNIIMANGLVYLFRTAPIEITSAIYVQHAALTAVVAVYTFAIAVISSEIRKPPNRFVLIVGSLTLVAAAIGGLTLAVGFSLVILLFGVINYSVIKAIPYGINSGKSDGGKSV